MEESATLIRQGELTIRLLQDAPGDYALLAHWLSDERVLEFYEGRDNPFSLEQVAEEFGLLVRGADLVTPCILVYRDAPVGYLQFYPVTEAERAEYGLPGEALTDVYGIDLFIGEPDLWNRGIGTAAVSALTSYLFAERQARQIVIDPWVENERAIRCYEKCGFRRVKVLPKHELHEGEYRDGLLMVLDRPTAG